MGQTCSTIVFACTPPAVKSNSMSDRLYDACNEFKEMCAGVFYDADLVGFELATGGSGHDGVLDLNGMTVPLDGIETHPVLGPMVAKAREQWPAFVAHVAAETSGKVKLLKAPRLYLTETETA